MSGYRMMSKFCGEFSCLVCMNLNENDINYLWLPWNLTNAHYVVYYQNMSRISFLFTFLLLSRHISGVNPYIISFTYYNISVTGTYNNITSVVIMLKTIFVVFSPWHSPCEKLHSFFYFCWMVLSRLETSGKSSVWLPSSTLTVAVIL